MEEPAPYTDGPGAAAGGGNCRFVESPSQDQRLQAQRLRNPEVRGSLQTPQNRPHGHQSPELPEGYGEGRTRPSKCGQPRVPFRLQTFSGNTYLPEPLMFAELCPMAVVSV